MEPESDADALGAAYERSLPLHVRRAGGVLYTPPVVARGLVEATLGALLAGGDAGGARVMDPACGGGAFLVAAYRRLLAWHAARGRLTPEARRTIFNRSIFGVDVDADAVEVTRRALAQVAEVDIDVANIRVGDALLTEDARRFDVVLANPPYVDAETMTRHHAALRAACHGRFAAASGNWDMFCVFIERCVEYCAAGGRIGMLVPNKLLSADYARAARAVLVRPGMCALQSVRIFSDGPVFAAGVYPVAFVAARGAAQGEVVCEQVAGLADVVRREVLGAEVFADSSRPWVLCAGEEARLVSQVRAAGRPLGELATVRGAATVAEAYALAGKIREGGPGLKIVNSGTLDPYEPLWGRRRMRYLGASYLRPVIPDALLGEVPAKRLQEARTPKVIVSGMTRRPEAVVDRAGELMAGKSTTIVTAAALDLRVIAAVLNSALMGWYHRCVFSGDRLAGGYMKIGPPQLRQLPIAGEGGGAGGIPALVDAMTERPEPAVARALDRAVAGLYGLSEAQAAWIDVRSRSLAVGRGGGKVEG